MSQRRALAGLAAAMVGVAGTVTAVAAGQPASPAPVVISTPETTTYRINSTVLASMGSR